MHKSFWILVALLLFVAPTSSVAQDQAAPAAGEAAPTPAAAPPAAAAPAAAPAGATPTEAAPAAPKVNGMQAGGGGPAALNQKTFKMEVTVRQIGEDGKKKPVEGAKVLVEAFAGQAAVKTYSAVSDTRGIATFDPLTAIKGVRYVPKVTHEGANYSAAGLVPDQDVETVAIDIYGRTFDDKGLVVTELVTMVDLWEGYIILTQNWSITNEGGAAFDFKGAAGERYVDGLPLALPVTAQGVQAVIAKPGGGTEEARVIENKVMIREPIPPRLPGVEPMRVQVRYSVPLESPSITYTQPLELKVEDMRVAVGLSTRFAKLPTLDLTMKAPGFASVQATDQVPGMRPGQRFLMASSRKAAAGEELTFTLDGYPVPEPWGVWSMLIGGLVVFLIGGFIYRKETSRTRGRTARSTLIKALRQEREDLFEDLRDLEERYDDRIISDRKYDLEAARLRERLALVLRRIQQEEELEKRG